MPTLAHSRSEDTKRGAKKEEIIKKLLIKTGWVAIRAPRQLIPVPNKFARPNAKGGMTRYFSRQMDFWSAADILALRARSKVLAVQSSTATNLSHKMEQIQASKLWPLLLDPLAMLDEHFDIQIWTWSYRVQDRAVDGVTKIPPPGWHFRVYAFDRSMANGTYWKRVASCDARGKPIEGWPLPAVLQQEPAPEGIPA